MDLLSGKKLTKASLSYGILVDYVEKNDIKLPKLTFRNYEVMVET